LLTKEKISKDTVMLLLEAARWAPSAKNIQPWKFVVVMDDDELRIKLASLSVYKPWLSNAPCLIAVFLDLQISYDFTKDAQAIGAAIQNMLLCGNEIGIGSCWVGEILNQESEVKRILGVSEQYQLMAVIAFGYPAKTAGATKRKEISESVLYWL
jgi:nitroreductase